MIRNFLDPKSNDNALFITAQCNNRCLMCCQPPSSADDLEFYFQNNCRIIEASAPFNYSQIALTGGEPTLLGTRLIPFIQYLQTKFPETTVHLLSNGRSFANAQYTKLFEDIDKEKLLIGIPLHSDYSGDHDMITQIKGSFSETMLGLYQLAAINIDIELRILIHKINWKRLPEIANFIYKNLPFVNFVAFMEMEYIGNAIQNHDLLWVDPYEYQKELEEAVLTLSHWRIPVCIYNLPHCILPQTLHSYAERSISDWKTCFCDFCNECAMQEQCSGLFSTSKWQSKYLKPFLNEMS